MFPISVLWRAPEVNPLNHKARSIPALNPVDMYGRVFSFAWMGFFVAFWSWYAFPPLLTITIRQDLQLTQADVLNSNIVALTATLLVRLVAGPLCDRFGPRLTFVGCLLAGAIPTALAGAVTNARGLLALRFFVGILGGSFVPCQVWTTGFFDRNVVGTANALTGGWGNSGGGITYFAMPAIFDSLVHARGLTPHVAWRVAFLVPFVIIVATALGMIFLCPDTPTGKWADRHLDTEQALTRHLSAVSVPVPGEFQEKPATPASASSHGEGAGGGGGAAVAADDKAGPKSPADNPAAEAQRNSSQHHEKGDAEDEAEIARGEVVVKPTWAEAAKVIFSLQTLVLAATYFCSFGGELAINSSLGSFYAHNFPALGQTGSGRWAAMFGLLNIVTRPLGGIISDILYGWTSSLWVKKMWNHAVGLLAGVFLIVIGVLDSHDEATMFGLVAAMAVFLEAGNGSNFSLVPHVHPYANGIVSGITGATGNFGGIIFAIIFRYNGMHYARTFWIMGVMTIAINLSVIWIRPIPKGQIGGR